MIAETARDEGGFGKRDERVLVVRGASTADSLQLMLQPVGGHEGNESASPPNRARVLLMLSSPGVAPAFPATLIGLLFALSPAESRLTAALCRGETVEDYARTAGVTIGTARFQLKQVLAKAQVRRQSELIRRVCSSVIAHARTAAPRTEAQNVIDH
jgi:DNA-binding CsgD family transcriptional regulator